MTQASSCHCSKSQLKQHLVRDTYNEYMLEASAHCLLVGNTIDHRVWLTVLWLLKSALKTQAIINYHRYLNQAIPFTTNDMDMYFLQYLVNLFSK